MTAALYGTSHSSTTASTEEGIQSFDYSAFSTRCNTLPPNIILQIGAYLSNLTPLENRDIFIQCRLKGLTSIEALAKIHDISLEALDTLPLPDEAPQFVRKALKHNLSTKRDQAMERAQKIGEVHKTAFWGECLTELAGLGVLESIRYIFETLPEKFPAIYKQLVLTCAPYQYMQQALKMAIKNKHLHVVEYLCSIHSAFSAVFRLCIEEGDIVTIQYMLSEKFLNFAEKVSKNSLRYTGIIAQWGIQIAAEKGQLDTIKYLYFSESIPDEWRVLSQIYLEFALKAALKNNHADVIAFLLSPEFEAKYPQINKISQSIRAEATAFLERHASAGNDA